MDKIEKLEAIEKVLRALDDIKNSETAVLKKVSQVEADNINLGIDLLEKALPDIHDFSDKSVEAIDALITEFTAYRDKFIKDNNLEPKEEDAGT